VYSIVFLDAIHYKVRSEGRIVSKAAYTAIGVNLDGIKEVPWNMGRRGRIG